MANYEDVLMNRCEPTMSESGTVEACVAQIREEERSRLSELGLAWVVDADLKLTGYVQAVDLLLSPEGTLIADIAKAPAIIVRMSEPLDDAMQQLRESGSSVAPVVDDSGELVASLAPSEVIAAMEQEATEDVAKMALAGEQGDTYFSAKIENVVNARAKWLLSLLMFQSLSSVVLDHFSALLSANLTLALFLTMITGTSGNAGNQSSAVVIRGIATGDILSKKDAFRVLRRELRVALPLMLVLSAASFARVLLTNASGRSLVLGIRTAAAITIAMAATVFSAIAIGAGAPLLLDSIGIDPANCASPTLATFVDLLGVILLCTIGTALLGGSAVKGMAAF